MVDIKDMVDIEDVAVEDIGHLVILLIEIYLLCVLWEIDLNFVLKINNKN